MNKNKKSLPKINRKFILFFIFNFFYTINSISETTVGGIIDKDTRWYAEKGPYYVIRDVLVTKRARLSITPGTQIIIYKPSILDNDIKQLNRLDSLNIKIIIEGALDCGGEQSKRIVFMPQEEERGCSWYGIVFKNAQDKYTEMSYTEIKGAYFGISVINCAPVIHHCQIEFNNVGIQLEEYGNASIYNCVIAYNYSTGIKIKSSNPVIMNNIVAFNINNGMWCDAISKITFEYNCVYGNADGNFIDCDPELGVLKKLNNNKDSVDYKNNIYKNPIFAGTEYDSMSIEKDISLPTEKSKVKDTSIARILHERLVDSIAIKSRHSSYPRYFLSKYSPCRHAANPSSEFSNEDGKRGDIGIFGATKFSPSKSKK